MANQSFIDVNQTEFKNALESFEKMSDSINPRYLKNTQARVAKREIVPDMKAGSKSSRIDKMIGVTTSKKRAGELGIKVGVVKNDPDKFPDISAPALASLIEYGTGKRYRNLKKVGLITGKQSTGAMPSAPFLRPAWDKNVGKFMNDVEEILLNRVEKNA